MFNLFIFLFSVITLLKNCQRVRKLHARFLYSEWTTFKHSTWCSMSLKSKNKKVKKHWRSRYFFISLPKKILLPKFPEQSASYSRYFYFHNFTIVQGSSKASLSKTKVFFLLLDWRCVNDVCQMKFLDFIWSLWTCFMD